MDKKVPPCSSNKVTKKKFKKNIIEEQQIDNLCSICLEDRKNELKLNCLHSFCKDCIAKWTGLENKSNCPNCRKEINYNQRCHLFDYCIEKRWYSKYIVTQYYITDPELISTVTAIIDEDTSYNGDEWILFKNYIFLDPSMEEKFNHCETITYTYYKRYDPDVQDVIEDNESHVYLYRINIEHIEDNEISVVLHLPNVQNQFELERLTDTESEEN